jgi:hypothetical protein
MHLAIYSIVGLVGFILVAKGGLAYADAAFRWFAERNGY